MSDVVLAATMTAMGVAGGVGAWLAAERLPRIALVVWVLTALLFGVGLFGLSDALCGGGRCQ